MSIRVKDKRSETMRVAVNRVAGCCLVFLLAAVAARAAAGPDLRLVNTAADQDKPPSARC
jgi:hypothetical protein